MYTAIGGPREPISIGIQVNSSPYQRASKTRLAIIIVSQNNHDIEQPRVAFPLLSYITIYFSQTYPLYYKNKHHSRI